MDEIADLLKSYRSDCQPTALEPLGAAGGLSGARFWRIVAPRGVLVLRRWPIEHPTPEGLQFIHLVLRHATDGGVKILPLPIATVRGETFVHHARHLWELCPWLRGTADYEKSPRVEKLRAGMTALAQFHVAVADFPRPQTPNATAGAPAIARRLARLVELQNGGIESLTRAISDHTWPDMAPLARQFAAQLPRAVPQAIARLAPLADVPLPLQPCLRDVWHDHVLFEGDTVTGLIDFGAVQIDTPATDVARLLGSLIGADASGWHEGIAAYSAARPLSDQESLAVPALDTAGTILAGCNWIHWIYVDGRTFESHQAVVDRIRKLVARTRSLV